MCTDIFINKGGYHIHARCMDFPINMGTSLTMGFVGQENTTNPVMDVDKIPASQLATWKNKYGFIGRSAFDTPVIMDGMNTQGVGVGILYLPNSKYPKFNPADKRPVLSCIELPTFILSQAKSVEEAHQLMQSHQLVDWAVEGAPGMFINGIPVHFAVRDKTGDSMVIEFIDGDVKIYRPAGNVMTNAPAFDWQLEYAKHYSSLNVSDEKPNKEMEQYVYKYDEIYAHSLRPAVNNMMGIPGDLGPASRFAKCTVFLNNMYAPNSSAEAVYQAQSILHTVFVPYMPGNTDKTKITTTTLWSTIKDLDNLVVRYLDHAYMQADQRVLPLSPENGYRPYDLKSINFNATPNEFEAKVFKPETRKDIKVVNVANVPGF